MLFDASGRSCTGHVVYNSADAASHVTFDDSRKTTVIVFKILAAQRTWLESGYRLTMPKPRQLFISQSEVLVQNVDKYYEKLELSVKVTNLSSEEIRTMAEERALKRDAGIFDADEELEWSLDLPQRYGALQDAHFPLFITYKHVS